MIRLFVAILVAFAIAIAAPAFTNTAAAIDPSYNTGADAAPSEAPAKDMKAEKKAKKSAAKKAHKAKKAKAAKEEKKDDAKKDEMKK